MSFYGETLAMDQCKKTAATHMSVLFVLPTDLIGNGRSLDEFF